MDWIGGERLTERFMMFVRLSLTIRLLRYDILSLGSREIFCVRDALERFVRKIR